MVSNPPGPDEDAGLLRDIADARALGVAADAVHNANLPPEIRDIAEAAAARIVAARQAADGAS